MGLLLGILIVGIVITGIRSTKSEENHTLGDLILSHFEKGIYDRIVKTFMPVLTYDETEGSREYLGAVLPIYSYMKINEVYDTAKESELTYEMIRAKEAADENHVDEKTGELVSQNKDQETEKKSQKSVVSFSKEKLSDFDYLRQNFYTVDRTTTITSDRLNAKKMLEKDMHLAKNVEGPQVLIYHTHSQEGYADSTPGDLNTSVVGVGEYLAQLLKEKYEIKVLHHTGTYDVNDRDHAYSNAESAIQKILEENPTIEVVIDLHRDGVAEGTRLVTKQDGKQMASIMFFNGLSHTTALGDISYLENPYIQDNLAFSFQLQLKAAEHYPGFARPIYLKGYRYNMHFKPKSLLVEVGAQTNTLEEAKNSMVPLADILNKVIME
ncbi:MAG: stage II sporulation protein P [Lachnospiraceae bacterium]|nr:stage II sporulation protein P [Lachnospiraceae bacterium]